MTGVISKTFGEQRSAASHGLHAFVNRKLAQEGNTNDPIKSEAAKSNDTTNVSGPQMQKFKIFRYHPARTENDEASGVPYMEDFEIDLKKTGPMVLDALFKIKDDVDNSLSFRRSCREGICGSCAMNINGVNGLACLHHIVPTQNSEAIEVRPLPHMFVLRDLVVDMTNFYNQHKEVQPYLRRTEDEDPNSVVNEADQQNQEDRKEIYQSKEDRKKLDGLYECILCACCSTSCPSYWWNSDTYLGPAALLQAYRWIADSRDQYKLDRLKHLNDSFKLFRCHGIMNCTVACPKNLSPAKAIAETKKLIAEHASLSSR